MRSTYVRRSGHGLDSCPEDDWRTRAACRRYDPQWWDLLSGKGDTADNKKAKLICAGCPVRIECREFADSTGSWGLIFAGVAYNKPNRMVVSRG